MTGVGRSQLYRKIKAGEFPVPVKVGVKSVRFHLEDIEEWAAKLPSGGPRHGGNDYWVPEGLGLKAVHQRPYVADDNKIIVGRRGIIEAWRDWHRLEINPPHAYAALLFDVDAPSERGWADVPWYFHRVPKGTTPSWIVHNLANGHMHVGYALELPVARHGNARLGPQKYAAHVADRLSVYLGADPGYRGLIHRNPINPGPGCEVWQPHLWLRTHTLDDLDRAIPKSVQPTPYRRSGVGRNVDLFAAMIKEAHRPRWADALASQGWRESWLDYVRGQNAAKLYLRFLVLTAARSGEARGGFVGRNRLQGRGLDDTRLTHEGGPGASSAPELPSPRRVAARAST